MKDDPAIKRVRDARHEISAECDHDPQKLLAYYLKRKQERQEREPKEPKEPQQAPPRQEA